MISFGDASTTLSESQLKSKFKALTIAIQQLKQYAASYASSTPQYFTSPSSPQIQHRKNTQNPAHHLINDISANVNIIEKRLPIDIIDASSRRQYILKLNHIKDELASLTEEIQYHDKKHERMKREQEILLDGATEYEPLQKHQHLVGQHMSIDRSLSVLEQIKDTGANVLGMLGEQSDTLKNARTKLLDMGVSLGVSQATLRSIERRLKMDAILVCVGMFVVLVILFLMWWYLM